MNILLIIIRTKISNVAHIFDGFNKKDGSSITKLPRLDGTNYFYWKVKITPFHESIDSKTWKTVITSWNHSKDKKGGVSQTKERLDGARRLCITW